jgi:hypothetical protein
MRGFWVTWSPDSPGSDAVKTRAEPGNPEAEKYLKAFTANYKQLPRGNPLYFHNKVRVRGCYRADGKFRYL